MHQQWDCSHTPTPYFSNGLSWSIPLFCSAGMETAPSSIKLEWATTTPSSSRSMKRSTPLIRLSSIQATIPITMITTWPWFVCHRGQWARCQESACHSAVMFFPPVCPWEKRECSNKPATVTLLAGVTQVRMCACLCVEGRWVRWPRGAKHNIISFQSCSFHFSNVYSCV